MGPYLLFQGLLQPDRHVRAKEHNTGRLADSKQHSRLLQTLCCAVPAVGEAATHRRAPGHNGRAQ